MSASLVGSEMCIRDSLRAALLGLETDWPGGGRRAPAGNRHIDDHDPVSYTHLTLPTICSV
eukprot:2631250-Alexandrium_andersonii.AAC.1